MAALGFLFIAGADIPPTSVEFATDMLRKLTVEGDVYDCACLLVVEGTAGIEEEPDEARPVEDEPAALRTLPSDEVEDEAAVDEGSSEAEAPVADRPSVSVRHDLIAHDLAPGRFFKTLICGALDRMPITIYPLVRERRTSAAAT